MMNKTISKYIATPLIALGMLGASLGVSAEEEEIKEEKPEVSVGINLGTSASIPYGTMYNIGLGFEYLLAWIMQCKCL